MSTPDTATISISEGAAMFGFSKDFMYDLARRRALPGLLVLGSRYRLSRVAVERALLDGWVPGEQKGKVPA